MTARRIALGAVAALAALLGGGPAAASAHPLLIQATPQPGLVSSATPSQITLSLSEPAVARGSRIRVTGPKGVAVPTSGVRGSGGGRTLTVSTRGKLRSAVYTVRWSALGDDGHIVTGSFGFGVAGAKGAAPPGVEALTGAGGGRGGETAAGDGVVRVIGRWLGILAASLLLGGFVLLGRLRRRGTPAPADGILEQVAPLTWVLVAMAATEGVLAGASAAAGGGLDLGLLTASATGVAELVRAVLVVIFTAVLVLVPARRTVAYPAGAAAVLLTYGLSGHVLSFPTGWALLDQGVHVLAAGLWLGGVLAVVLVTRRDGVRVLDAARAFAPVAGAALGVAVLTGVLAAVREVDRWYFLRWSDYGRVVLIKAALVALVSLAGAVAWWRSRSDGAPGPWPRVLRAEAFGVVAVLVLATVLSGMAQGRGQPLPAQKGTLFPGPALATAQLPGGPAPLGLAPARRGANVVTVALAAGQPAPHRVSVKLVRPGGTPLRATLRPHGGRTWSAPVSVPADGTWYAYVSADGKTAPPATLSVGVPHAAGAPPVVVLSVADLSGPAGERCRAHVIGVEMALARLNAAGGLDGGHKVVPLVLDSGGTAAGAARAAARGLAAHPVATVGVCGGGGDAAVTAAARAGIPSVVGDPTVDPVAERDVFRLAADPYVQGLAIGQLVRARVLAAGVPGVRTVRAVAGRDVAGRRLVAGLRAGLRDDTPPTGAPPRGGPAPRLVVLAPGALARLTPDALADVLDRRRTTALVLDGPDQGGGDAAAVARLGTARGDRLAPPPVLASERVLSEGLVLASGALGRIGAVQGVTEVATNTTDAELYQQAVPLLFRGDLASLDGLRGYAAGLALRDAVRDGTSASSIVRRLQNPRVFTNALLAPWSRRHPGAGSPYAVAIQPQFLAPGLVPAGSGGEAQDTAYFPQGSWTVTSATPLGLVPGLEQPPV